MTGTLEQRQAGCLLHCRERAPAPLPPAAHGPSLPCRLPYCRLVEDHATGQRPQAAAAGAAEPHAAALQPAPHRSARCGAAAWHGRQRPALQTAGNQHTQQGMAGQGAASFDNTTIQWTETETVEEANPVLPPNSVFKSPNLSASLPALLLLRRATTPYYCES